MADLLDRAILIGMGLETKLKELLEELEKAGEKERGEKKEEAAAPITPKQAVENRVVDEAVKLIKELLSTIKSAGEKLEGELGTASEKIAEKLHVATRDELDVTKEMSRVAREKVDELEKRVAVLEGKILALEKKTGL